MTYVNDGAPASTWQRWTPRKGGQAQPGSVGTPLVGRTEVTPVSDSTAAQRGMQRESGGALPVGVAGFKGTRTSEEIMVQNSFGAQAGPPSAP